MAYSLYHRKIKRARRRGGAVIGRKIGRPLKAKTLLAHDTKVRLDDELNERLCRYCEITGMEKAAVLRAGLIQYLDIKEKEKTE